jgi:hypothetical protein
LGVNDENPCKFLVEPPPVVPPLDGSAAVGDENASSSLVVVPPGLLQAPTRELSAISHNPNFATLLRPSPMMNLAGR